MAVWTQFSPPSISLERVTSADEKQCEKIFVTYVVLIQTGKTFYVCCPHSLHRHLMEDVETHEDQILKGWKELDDKREIVELKEVCARVCVCACVC